MVKLVVSIKSIVKYNGTEYEIVTLRVDSYCCHTIWNKTHNKEVGTMLFKEGVGNLMSQHEAVAGHLTCYIK